MGDVVPIRPGGQPDTSLMSRYLSEPYLTYMRDKPEGVRRLYDALVASADAGMGMEALLHTIANPFSKTLEDLIDDLNGEAMRLYEEGAFE